MNLSSPRPLCRAVAEWLVTADEQLSADRSRIVGIHGRNRSVGVKSRFHSFAF